MTIRVSVQTIMQEIARSGSADILRLEISTFCANCGDCAVGENVMIERDGQSFCDINCHMNWQLSQESKVKRTSR